MLATVVALYNLAGLTSLAPLWKEGRRSVVEKETSGPGGYSIAGGDDAAGYGSRGFGGAVQRARAIRPSTRYRAGGSP
jgi:hypothetical protein